MRVKQLKVQDFRNYVSGAIEFAPGINVLSGDNAQGKTNLLEAVCMCSMGRSMRTPRDKELIKQGSQRAKIALEVVSRSGKDSVDIIIDKSLNKSVMINTMPISRIGELMGVAAAVFFSPDEMKIVKDSPGDRRRFMDIALCQMSKAYFYLLSRYNKILAQRNKLLKSGRADGDSLDVWDMQLAGEGAKVIKTRRGYISRLEKYAAENHGYLTALKEKLELNYEGIVGESLEEIRENFLKELNSCRARELILGYTTSGPQKDDIKVVINGIDVRSFGSQGQQRTAALSLKLSELDLFNSEKGEYPILLLDDVLSELDISRQKQLLKRISGFQTILTCTHLPEALAHDIGDFSHFFVKYGTVKKI